MQREEIEKRLRIINEHLIKNDCRNLLELLEDKSPVIDNMNLHRFEFLEMDIRDSLFIFSSFRGAYIQNCLFVNCHFKQCSFVVTSFINTIFINCDFDSCIFRGHFLDNNMELNCVFSNCYDDDEFIIKSHHIL